MKITFHPSIYLYLAILLLILPVKWLVAWFIAVCFHEFFHYVAIKLCGGTSYNLSVGFGGAIISCSDLTSKRLILVLLAGPAGGMLLLLSGRWFPQLALCSWVLSVYNLIPLLPLDGGQALQLLINNSRLFHLIERIILVLLMASSVFLSLKLHFGPLPVTVVAMLWIKNRNSPCKELVCKVQ